MNHWYFTEQVVADHQHALHEQADAHQTGELRVAARRRPRWLTLRLRFARRRRELLAVPGFPAAAPRH